MKLLLLPWNIIRRRITRLNYGLNKIETLLSHCNYNFMAQFSVAVFYFLIPSLQKIHSLAKWIFIYFSLQKNIRWWHLCWFASRVIASSPYVTIDIIVPLECLIRLKKCLVWRKRRWYACRDFLLKIIQHRRFF